MIYKSILYETNPCDRLLQDNTINVACFNFFMKLYTLKKAASNSHQPANLGAQHAMHKKNTPVRACGIPDCPEYRAFHCSKYYLYKPPYNQIIKA